MGDSSAVLEQLVLQDLPCPDCLDAHVAACRAWRGLGIPVPPGHDGDNLGTLWAWSGRPSGPPDGCTSGCNLNRYLRSLHSALLGGVWHGIRVEFQGGVGPAAEVRKLHAWREANAARIAFSEALSGAKLAAAAVVALPTAGAVEEPPRPENAPAGPVDPPSRPERRSLVLEDEATFRSFGSPRIVAYCDVCRRPILSGEEFLGANATRHRRCA